MSPSKPPEVTYLKWLTPREILCSQACRIAQVGRAAIITELSAPSEPTATATVTHAMHDGALHQLSLRHVLYRYLFKENGVLYSDGKAIINCLHYRC